MIGAARISHQRSHTGGAGEMPASPFFATSGPARPSPAPLRRSSSPPSCGSCARFGAQRSRVPVRIRNQAGAGLLETGPSAGPAQVSPPGSLSEVRLLAKAARRLVREDCGHAGGGSRCRRRGRARGACRGVARRCSRQDRRCREVQSASSSKCLSSATFRERLSSRTVA